MMADQQTNLLAIVVVMVPVERQTNLLSLTMALHHSIDPSIDPSIDRPAPAATNLLSLTMLATAASMRSMASMGSMALHHSADPSVARPATAATSARLSIRFSWAQLMVRWVALVVRRSMVWGVLLDRQILV
jgi:hypothetical protein